MKRYSREIMIVLIVILSRLPFIFNSLGSDLDAWREVYTGKILYEDHLYNVSRFPGYPFPEFLYTLVYNKPYWCINLLSVLFTVGCCLYLFRILKFLKMKFSFFTSIVFSFVPIIYINSTVAMEYNWSLFFLLGSVYYLLKKNIWTSALFLGLMISARFNNIIFLPALLSLAYFHTGKEIKKTIHFLLLSSLFTGIFFSPVLLKYGLNFFQNSGDSEFNLASLLSLGTLYVYGALGVVAISLALVMQFFLGGYQKTKEPYRNYFMVFCVVIIVLNLVFFIKYPLEAGYLIPSVPFVLIFLQHILNERLMKFVLVSLFLSPFLIHLNTTKVQVKGSIFANEDYEDQELKYCNELVTKIKHLSGNKLTVFHLGNYTEQVILMGNFDTKSGIRIIKNLSMADEDAILNKGYELYYINTVDGTIENNKTHIIDQQGILLHENFELRK